VGGGASAGGPAISPDGRYIAFSGPAHEQRLLYVMQADGTNARIVTDLLNLEGAPAWAPDGQSIMSAAEEHGVPRPPLGYRLRSRAGAICPRVLDRSLRGT